MIRYVLTIVLLITFWGCGTSNTDPMTPDGAHNLFVQALGQKDYKAVYELLTQDTKKAFHYYIENTKEVVSIIRTNYPSALQEKAIADLSIPFKADTFTYKEIEFSSSEGQTFMRLCEKMFSSKDETPSLMQKVGTRVQSVELENPNKAIIKTLASETLVYIKEPDQHWRTAEIFGVNFNGLVMVSRQNMDITKLNVEIFSK